MDLLAAYNRQWSAGDPAMADSLLAAARTLYAFLLQAASRAIVFDVDAGGEVMGLTYVLPNATHRYRKIG